MNEPLKQLRELWERHQLLVFPRSRPDVELSGIDFMDLVELDTFISGYVSRMASGEALSHAEGIGLRELHVDLRAKVVALSGQTRAYFKSLDLLAEAAVSMPQHLQ